MLGDYDLQIIVGLLFFLGNCCESSISLGCFIKSLDDFLVRDGLVFGDYDYE